MRVFMERAVDYVLPFGVISLPIMALIPAFCPHCGNLFESRMFHFDGDITSLHLEGNRETCPNCNNMAQVVDGTFNTVGGALAMISGPQITADVLRKFGVLAQSAIEKKITTEELQRQATDIDPMLGDMVNTIGKSNALLPIVLMLIVLYLKGCQFHIDAKLDINHLFDQISSQRNAISLEAKPPDTKGGSVATGSDATKPAKPTNTPKAH